MSLELNLTKIDKPTAFQNVLGQPERYRGVTLMIPNVSFPAGAGANIPVPLNFYDIGLTFKDTNYVVCFSNTSSQALGFTILPTDKTTIGFLAEVYPIDTTATVAAGTCDVIIFYQD